MYLKKRSSGKTAKTPSLKSKTSALAAQISLETYFTDSNFFAVETATPVQRAKCRLIEGLPLGELASDPSVIEMCGGTVPDYSVRATEVLDISAVRIGKSLFGASLILWMSQTVDLSGTRSSDIVRIFVVAIKMDNCKAVLKHLFDTLINKPALRTLLVDDPKDLTLNGIAASGLQLRHPSGKVIEVRAIPLDRGGGSGVSVYCAGMVVDEYPRMIGADDGVRNVEHFRDATAARLLPGAVALFTGSPWQPYGPAYDMTMKHFGKPTPELLVLRTSAKPFVGIAPGWPVGAPEKLQRTKPLSYKTDYLAEFADGEEAVFPAQAIEDAVARHAVSAAEYGRPAIFADPSALRHDYWAAMVGGWVYPIASREDLYEHEFLGDTITPSPTGARGQVIAGKNGWIRILEDEYGNPRMKLEAKVPRPWFEVYDIKSWDKASGARGLDLVRAVGEMGRQYGCADFHWDGYEQLMLADLIRQQDLRPVVHTWSGQGRKTEAVDHLRTLFVERRVRLPQHSLLKQELLRFTARATPGGNFQYIVAGGGGHGDHASCLTLASRADLDGFVDRSPTRRSVTKNEVLDYDETEDFDDDFLAP
jgi:hypothetical protein